MFKAKFLVTLAASAILSVPAMAAPPQYVGASSCKACHLKEHATWLASPHSKAFEKLPEKDRANPDCVKCHVTGHGAAAAPAAKLEGVQCEVCHGPGSEYKSMKIMSKKVYEAGREKAHAMAVEAGLLKPTEATCRGCHNEKSPHFKGFDFKTMSEKIKHWK